MPQLISQSHALCTQALQQLHKAATESQRCSESFQLVFLDEIDKYEIWSGNLGAGHAGRTYKLSLDYRLREATFYKDQVISMIDTLQRHAESARQIISGERKPFEDFSESDSDQESVGLSPSNNEPLGKGHNSPWESSSESGSEPEFETSKAKSEAWDETSGLVPPDTELAQLLESIKLTIRSLYKLPIRKPAPVDRLKGNYSDKMSCYQPFDRMYVRDKFPYLSFEVADRIASHVTRRRQLLLYRQEHQELLRPKKVQIEPEISLVLAESRNINIKQHLVKNGDEASSAQLHHATASQPESKSENLRSTATTLLHDGKQLLQQEFLPAPSVAESISQTSIAASQFTREMPVEVPPRPKDLKGTNKTMFECKFCVLTTYIESDRVWKNHVLSDLHPYVCTFPECILGDYVFATRDAWFQHEMQIHRVEYFCNTEAHPVHRNLSEFRDHMQREHDISLSNLANPAAMNMFRRPVSSSEGICNLCFREKPVRNMKSHVSKHLEQISLFAIPRAEYSEGDVDAEENQSYQLQHDLEESIPQDDGPEESNPRVNPPSREQPISQDDEPKDRNPIMPDFNIEPSNAEWKLRFNEAWSNFMFSGDPIDLNELVDVAEQAYLGLPDDHPDKGIWLQQLALILCRRSVASLNLSDLEVAIALYDIKPSILPLDSPEGSSLTGLEHLRQALRQLTAEGNPHFTREDETEHDASQYLPGPQDLKERACSMSNADSANSLVRMAHAQSILLQYSKTADPEYLNKAVQYTEQGVNNAKETSGAFHWMVSELSRILALRYGRMGEPKDLDKAITEAQRAYDMVSPAKVYKRASKAVRLAKLLSTRFSDFGTSDDLELAIKQMNDAIENLRKDDTHTLPPQWLRTLAILYSQRFARTRDSQDIRQARSLLFDSLTSGPPITGFESLRDLLNLQSLILQIERDTGSKDFRELATQISHHLQTLDQSQEVSKNEADGDSNPT